MIVTATEFAEFVGKSNAWVSKQIERGLPVEKIGVAGDAHEIDSAIAVNWLIDRIHGIPEHIVTARVQQGREMRAAMARLRRLEKKKKGKR